jgi:hypothetical protein
MNGIAQDLKGKKAGKGRPANQAGQAAALQPGNAGGSKGIGNQVSVWARQGLHGPALAAAIHQLRGRQ